MSDRNEVGQRRGEEDNDRDYRGLTGGRRVLPSEASGSAADSRDGAERYRFRDGVGEGDVNRSTRESGTEGGSPYSPDRTGQQGDARRGFGYEQQARSESNWDKPALGSSYGGGRYGGQHPGAANGSTELRQGAGSESRGDQPASGQFRGKGPKGYQRTDERLRERICEHLMDDEHIDASDITVTVAGSTVTLEGSVDSRRTKFDVEECAEHCGAEDIVNHLKIRRSKAGGAAELRSMEDSPLGTTQGISKTGNGQ